MPGFFGGERSEECAWNGQKATSYFAWFILGPKALFHTILVLFMTNQVSHSPSHLVALAGIIGTVRGIAAVVFLIAYAVWFIWVQFLWGDISSECVKGWNLLDFINFLVVFGSVAIQSLVITIIIVVIIIALPFLICYGADLLDRLSDMVGDFVKKFDFLIQTEFEEEPAEDVVDCSDCHDKFDDDAVITSLPCDGKHFFCAKCVKEGEKECRVCLNPGYYVEELPNRW